MQSISHLLFRHRGQHAWLFGKGPSLDAFDMGSAGPLRICVNESVRAVDSPTYFFAHDEGPIARVASVWTSGCTAILQPIRARFAMDLGVPKNAIYVYEKRYADNHIRDLPPEEIARSASLYGNSGTVHCAIHFCRLIGVQGITLVGFDGAGGYAKKVSLPDGGANHQRIRQDAISLLDAVQLPYKFFGGSSNAV